MPDQIEANLKHLAETLTTAWTKHSCLTCPLAELAALAQATLVYYHERTQPSTDDMHWSDRRRHQLEKQGQ